MPIGHTLMLRTMQTIQTSLMSAFLIIGRNHETKTESINIVLLIFREMELHNMSHLIHLHIIKRY